MAPVQVNITTLSTKTAPPQWGFGAPRYKKPAAETAPGPGKYGEPNYEISKFPRSKSCSFGSTQRNCLSETPVKNKKREMPGPGAYGAPDQKGLAAPKWGFGPPDQDRVPKQKVSETPPPGHYMMQSTLSHLGATMASRRSESGRSPSVPGPGAYKFKADATENKSPEYMFSNATEKRDKDDIKVKAARTVPGPGHYKSLPELARDGLRDRRTPAVLFNSRRPAPKNDTAQDHVTTLYSQFGKKG